MLGRKVRILLFMTGAYGDLLISKIPEYFHEAETEVMNLETNGKGVPTFEKVKDFDIILFGGHGNTLRNITQEKIGNLMVRVLEETSIGIVTTMWMNEMTDVYGLAGKWRTDHWNPINTRFSSQGYYLNSGRKLKYLVPRFEKFPELKECTYNIHYGDLNQHRKVRVIAEWQDHGYSGGKIYGIVELIHYKSLQLNFHPYIGEENFKQRSSECILKCMKYIYNRPKVIGRKTELEIEDLEERLNFLIHDEHSTTISCTTQTLKIPRLFFFI